MSAVPRQPGGPAAGRSGNSALPARRGPPSKSRSAIPASKKSRKSFAASKTETGSSWGPMSHWTDCKIRIHAFYCMPGKFFLLIDTSSPNQTKMSTIVKQVFVAVCLLGGSAFAPCGDPLWHSSLHRLLPSSVSRTDEALLFVSFSLLGSYRKQGSEQAVRSPLGPAVKNNVVLRPALPSLPNRSAQSPSMSSVLPFGFSMLPRKRPVTGLKAEMLPPRNCPTRVAELPEVVCRPDHAQGAFIELICARR